MTTYYDYLRDRALASSANDPAQLEHLIHVERNALWQQIVVNPAYDEHNRLRTLAAFDEAAARLLSEQGARFGRVPRAMAGSAPNGGPLRAPQGRPRGTPRSRSVVRDLVCLLLGAALGVSVGYFAKDALAPMLSSADPANSALGVRNLTASQKTFRFVRSQPSALEGELTVDYAPGTPTETYKCEVEATYAQVLEYVRFEESCQKVAFKFLPLSELWKNFNYVEGYMVFSTTITSPAGAQWQGSASVYFSINATT